MHEVASGKLGGIITILKSFPQVGSKVNHHQFHSKRKRTNISTRCARKLSDASMKLGLALTPEDWMFRASEIKKRFRGKNGGQRDNDNV